MFKILHAVLYLFLALAAQAQKTYNSNKPSKLVFLDVNKVKAHIYNKNPFFFDGSSNRRLATANLNIVNNAIALNLHSLSQGNYVLKLRDHEDKVTLKKIGVK